ANGIPQKGSSMLFGVLALWRDSTPSCSTSGKSGRFRDRPNAAPLIVRNRLNQVTTAHHKGRQAEGHCRRRNWKCLLNNRLAASITSACRIPPPPQHPR